jgi:signal transduction histidine kinase
LRAPLRAIRAFSEILSDKFGNQLGPEGKELAERIIDGARRLDQLIQDVLSFGRVGREEIALDAVDLEELLGRLIATWPELRPPNAEVAIAGPLLKVLGHENLLSQCFLNLLQNAVKFVAPGRPPKVRIWTEARDGRVRVWVEDNGIGIAKDQQERIFGLFQRLHRQDAYPGTGVGLAIVRKAVERMGGTTGVESDPGQGSRFWLELAQPVI